MQLSPLQIPTAYVPFSRKIPLENVPDAKILNKPHLAKAVLQMHTQPHR